MNPLLWGGDIWRSCHWIVEMYPEKPSLTEQKKYSHFFMSLSHVLPCASCQIDFQQELKRNPPKLTSRLSLRRWLWEVHNNINARIKKTSIAYPYAQLDIDYSNQQVCHGCKKKKNMTSSF